MIIKLLSSFFFKHRQKSKVFPFSIVFFLTLFFGLGISGQVMAQKPQVTLVKSAVLIPPNNSIAYSFVLTNTGTVPVTGIKVNDPKIVFVTTFDPTLVLAPGKQVTFTAKNYAITNGEKDAGQVHNIAFITVYSTLNKNDSLFVGSQPTASSRPGLQTYTTVPETPVIALVKTAKLSTDGKSITYSFTLSNTGNVTLKKLTLTDAKLNGDIPIPQTDVISTLTSYPVITRIYTITQADRDADKVTNSAIATGVSPVSNTTVSDVSGSTNTNNDPTVVLLPEHPSVKMVKSGILSGDGNRITYSFAVTNTGDVTLKNLVVTDSKLNEADITDISGTLAPGATVTVTGTYILSQADKDAGTVSNTASLTGSSVAGTAVNTTSSTTVTVPPHPSVKLLKTGVLSSYQSTINYTFTITNTGNVTLNNFTLSDPLIPALAIVTPFSLPSGEMSSITASYPVTQADKDADEVNNTASVTATSNLRVSVQSSAASTVPIPETPSVNLVKTGVYTADNSTINYTFTVTNTGTVTLKNLAITDSKITGPIVFNSPGDLAPNATATATASYVVSAADKAYGLVRNQATVTGITYGNSTVTATASSRIIISDLAVIKLVKTGVLSADGNTVNYAFDIFNQGDLTLTNLVLTDVKLPGALTIDPAVTIPPAGDLVVNATYQITQTEKDAHQVVNQATATGTIFTDKTVTDGSGTVLGNHDPTVVPVPEHPAIVLVKTGVLSTDENTINYTFTLTNTGNVTLRTLTLADPKLSAFNIDPAETLSPGVSKVLTAAYTVTQSEKDIGQVTNTGTATGISPAGTVVSDISGTSTDNDNITVVNVPLVAAIDFTKLATGSVPSAADGLINYTLKVTNTGTVSLRNIVISDPNAIITSGSPIPLIGANESAIVTATHQLTQADVDAGQVINQATAIGTEPNGSSVSKVSDDPSTVVANDPTVTPIADLGAIALVKTGVVNNNATKITYTFTITNTGNVTLKNIVLADPLLGASINQTQEVLSPGQSVVVTQTYTLLQKDRDNGQVTNSATVSALTPLGKTVTDISGTDLSNDTPTVIVIGTIPAIDLVLTGVITADFATVTYSFTATNIGNVALQNLNLVDPKLNNPVALSASVIEPGETVTGTATYTVTDQEKRDGLVTNTATITGYTPVSGGYATDISGTAADNDNPTVILINKSPQAVNDFAETTIDHPVTFSLTANDLPSFNGLDAGSIVITTYPLHGQVQVFPDGTVTYTPNFGYAGTDSFMYNVTDLKGKLSNVALVSINISLINLFIPNTFTPNGDGKNDTFKIVGKEDFDTIDVMIVNRWGNEVYRNKNYQDNWDGSNLSEGTYYYIIILKKGVNQVVKKGWILLKR